MESKQNNDDKNDGGEGERKSIMSASPYYNKNDKEMPLGEMSPENTDIADSSVTKPGIIDQKSSQKQTSRLMLKAKRRSTMSSVR